MTVYNSNIRWLDNPETRDNTQLCSQVVEVTDEDTGEIYYEHYLHDFPNMSFQILGVAINKEQLKTMIETHKNLNNIFTINGRL